MFETCCPIRTKRAVGVFCTLLLLPVVVSAEVASTGVPRLDPNYSVNVEQWWASHPFNPESPQYDPQITSPAPVREIPDGASIQQVIDALPAGGGTVKLEPGSYDAFQIVGRSNVHVTADGNAIIRGPVRVASSREAMDYGRYDAAVSRGRRNPQIWELHKQPTRNFYFRNLTFDGDHRHVGLVGLQRVYDVVFDRCTFQNGVNPKAGHPGQLWGHEGLNNIWCRQCRFLGECGYASYLDG